MILINLQSVTNFTLAYINKRKQQYHGPLLKGHFFYNDKVAWSEGWPLFRWTIN